MNQITTSDLKSIQVVYAALMIGPLLFLLIAVFLNQMNGAFVENDKDFMNIMLALSIVFSISAISAGIFIFNNRMKALNPGADVLEKIQLYRSVMIVKAALFEGAAFFAIVNYLLFGHYLFVVIGLACLGIMGIYFPVRKRIAQELQLEEKQLSNL
jgi:hypothetical protein